MSEPQKLGKYEIRRQLGRGAMGIVYEGYDPFIQRTVALKTIRKEVLDQGEAREMLARFQREAQAGGRLSHPNIVAIHDYGEDQETAYIAMEFIQGKELKALFAENARFAMTDVLNIMSQLLSALDYSHRNGVVHRDIKPANIIVMADGQVKIADFGIARLESSNLTQTGSVLGTPNYMSPEQFMGQHVDGRSDLFSAGVILYQLLTGEKPFVGESTTTIMYQVLNNTPNPPSVLNVQIPAAFDGVVRKALAKRPEDRFQTGQEFLDTIRMAAEGKPFYSDVETTITAIRPPAVAAMAPQPPAVPPEAGTTAAQPQGKPLDKRLLLGAGAALAVLIVVAVLMSGGGREDAAPLPAGGQLPEAASQQAVQAPAADTPKKPVAAPAAVAKSTPSGVKKPSAKKSATENAPSADPAQEKPKSMEPAHAGENTGKSAAVPAPHADKPSSSHEAPPKPAEKKKGLFGEDLKPSQWRKDGELF
jgi:serine/threonine-protein kinase